MPTLEQSIGQPNVNCCRSLLLIFPLVSSKPNFHVLQTGRYEPHDLKHLSRITRGTQYEYFFSAHRCFFSGRGTIPNAARAVVENYTGEQRIHFITFIQSLHITTDIPFGEQKLKLSSGEKLVVPDVIRHAILHKCKDRHEKVLLV